MKAKLRGTEIYFDIAGMQIEADHSEKPVMFMLHGGPGGDHMRYKQHSIELQDVAQLVFIDHRGSGRSKKTHAREYTLENNIEDVEALRKHLGLERICILGTSYGGMVAQGYAIRYPKQVDKLILVVTAPSYRFIDEARKLVLKRGNAKQIEVCDKLWKGKLNSHDDVMEFFNAMQPFYSFTIKKNQAMAYNMSQSVYSYEALNQAFKPNGFLRKFDLIPKLKKITSPTLILAGKHDWICSAEQSRVMAKHIPNSTLKIFRDSSHALAVDVHDEYITIIKKFLKKKVGK
jgi:proline iminopeptidase